MHKHLRFRDSIASIMEGTSHMYVKPLEWLEFSPTDVDQLTQNLHGIREKMMQFLKEKNMLIDSINQKNAHLRMCEAANAELIKKVQILETNLKDAALEMEKVIAEKKMIEGKFKKIADNYGEHLESVDAVVEHLREIVQGGKSSRSLNIGSAEQNSGIAGPSRFIVTGEDLFDEEDPSEEEDEDDIVQRYIKQELTGEPSTYHVVDGIIILDEE